MPGVPSIRPDLIIRPDPTYLRRTAASAVCMRTSPTAYCRSIRSRGGICAHKEVLCRNTRNPQFMSIPLVWLEDTAKHGSYCKTSAEARPRAAKLCIDSEGAYPVEIKNRGLRIARSRTYLHTLGRKVRILDMYLEPWGKEGRPQEYSPIVIRKPRPQDNCRGCDTSDSLSTK